MTSAAEHYTEAERLLQQRAAEAQVHATLALVGATMLTDRQSPESERLRRLVSGQPEDGKRSPVTYHYGIRYDRGGDFPCRDVEADFEEDSIARDRAFARYTAGPERAIYLNVRRIRRTISAWDVQR